MAYPTGSGSERLNRVFLDAQSGGAHAILTVAANHIVTVLNVTICNMVATAYNTNLHVSALGSTTVMLMEQPLVLPATGTFVWNDKIVLIGTDVLKVYSASTNYDVYCSYIDQDWS